MAANIDKIYPRRLCFEVSYYDSQTQTTATSLTDRYDSQIVKS
jgi:hypothetical protein